MIGIQRRKRLEGWAQEVSEAEASGAPYTLRQRIGEDNRLWLIATGIIVIAAFWMIMHARPQLGLSASGSRTLPSCNGTYDDAKHQEFTSWLLDHKAYAGKVLQAEFVAPGNFRMFVPDNTSFEDVRRVGTMAAWHIQDKLREQPTVNIYWKTPSGSQEKVGAIIWSPERGTYVLKTPKQSQAAL